MTNIKILMFTILMMFSVTSAHAQLPHSGFADLVEKTSPAVVVIKAKRTSNSMSDIIPGVPPMPGVPPEMLEEFKKFFEKRGRIPVPRSPQAGIGAGFIISEDGYIVTNHHVIDKSNEISIELSDGRTFDAVVIGSDPKTDLAVLDVKADNLPYIEFGSSDKMRVGDVVIAIGSPFGLSGSVSAGIISAKERDIGTGPYDSFIQTDAAINKGNSGGPLMNTNGEVIAVNSAIFSNSGGSVGIGFAIPSAIAQKIVNDLIDDGGVERGWLGVQIQPVTKNISDALNLDKNTGVLVSDIFEDSPAEMSGLKVGDIIVAYNGKPVNGMTKLPLYVSQTDVGEIVSIQVMRDGLMLDINVTIALMKDESANLNETPMQPKPSSYPNLEDFGLKLQQTPNGIIVQSVKVNSKAKESGFEIGDKIVRLGSKDSFYISDIETILEDGVALVHVEKVNGDKIFLVIE
jgi:serine protease Do